MGLTRRLVLATLLLIPVGIGLWLAHATAWDLGRRSPVLSFDAAQYAVAARELADHGRWATPFALPIELARHPNPPWPLAVLQPGLVVAEAALFRMFPRGTSLPGAGRLQHPVERERLALVLPFLAYLGLAALIGFGAGRLAGSAVAGFLVGAVFLLDPEAQHFAVGGFTELPFTLGLAAACYVLARGGASRRPLVFGLLLGLTGAFRGSMFALAPVFACGAALVPEEGTVASRVRIAALVLLGYALPLAPWWIYKMQAFGSPNWDLTVKYAAWDGIGSHSWFSLSHLPVEPSLPRGGEALAEIGPKIVRNSARLASLLVGGPRAIGIAALGLWIALPRVPRALRIAGALVLAQAVVSLVVAAVGAAWLRYLFPSRVVLEAAGLLAAGGLVAVLPLSLPARARNLLLAGLAVLVLARGVRQTAYGIEEARASSMERGSPATPTLVALATQVAEATDNSEVVMSNLGPSLAWYAKRPVLHLARTPDDLAACRDRRPFRHVVLAFRDPAHAWAGWSEVMADPVAAVGHAGWGIVAERHGVSPDGFLIVWLELAEPPVAEPVR